MTMMKRIPPSEPRRNEDVMREIHGSKPRGEKFLPTPNLCYIAAISQLAAGDPDSYLAVFHLSFWKQMGEIIRMRNIGSQFLRAEIAFDCIHSELRTKRGDL